MEMLFKLLVTLMTWLKSFVFKNEKEYDFKSKDFNGIKFSLFLMIVVLIAVEAYSLSRLYLLAVQNIELTEQIKSCKK